MNTIGLYIVNHNNGRFLSSAIYSVLWQSSAPDDFVIYDNNSSDLISLNVLKNAELLGLKVVYLKTSNLIDAANKALKDSECDYIMRLDADDILRKNAVECYRRELTLNSNLGLLIPSYNIVNSNCVLLGRINKRVDSSMPMLPPHGAVTLVHRLTLEYLGGYIVKFNRQDGYMLWALFMKSGKSVRVLKESLFYYRQHVNSLSFNRRNILAARYAILEDLVPQDSLKYDVFFYGLRGDNMEELVNRNSLIINNAENAYLYFPDRIDYPGLTYLHRELNVLGSYSEIYNQFNLQMNDLNVFINPNYSGDSISIIHLLMTAKLTGEVKKFVLANRIKSEIYLVENQVESISFGSNLFNENPIFMKIPGLEVLPRCGTATSPVYIIEHCDLN